MDAHLLLNLLKKLRKLGKIGGSALHFIAFSPPKKSLYGSTNARFYLSYQPYGI